jgi:hypothetical protein
LLDYYDLVRTSTGINESLAKRLGFKSFFTEESDFHFAKNPGEANGNIMLYSSKNEGPGPYLKNGIRAIAPQDLDSVKEIQKYVKDMADYGTALLIDASLIEIAYGTYRSLLIGKISECTALMLKKDIRICLATLAKNSIEMLAAVQLIAVGEAIGLNEEEARKAVSANKNIITKTGGFHDKG